MTASQPSEPALPDRFRVQSRFADVDVPARDVITFPDGVPGYESTKAFVLIDLPEMAPLKVLHPVGECEPCFLVVDPKHVLSSYRCDLGASDRLRLGTVDESTLVWLTTVVVDEAGVVAVNLRAPIVIDPVGMTGRQVMPNACLYPLRYVIDAPS